MQPKLPRLPSTQYFIIRHRTKGFFLSFDAELYRPIFFRGAETSTQPHRFPSYSAALCQRSSWPFGLQRNSYILQRDAAEEASNITLAKRTPTQSD
jgi:hypothetical protein